MLRQLDGDAYSGREPIYERITAIESDSLISLRFVAGAGVGRGRASTSTVRVGCGAGAGLGAGTTAGAGGGDVRGWTTGDLAGTGDGAGTCDLDETVDVAGMGDDVGIGEDEGVGEAAGCVCVTSNGTSVVVVANSVGAISVIVAVPSLPD